MKPQHIRTLGRIVGLVAVLGIASIAAGQPLSDQQITRQLVDRLAENDAFQNVRVSVQEHIVSLTGTVPSLWAKTTAIAKARQTTALRSVMSDALTIESAESDRAIAEQIAQDMRRVSIPGPSAAARSGVSTAPGIAESNVPPGRFNRHGIDSGFGHGRFGDPFDHSWPHVGRDHFEHHTSDPDLHGPASFDFRHHLRGVGPHGFGIGGQGQLQSELHEAQYGHTGDSFYGIFDSVDGWIDGGVVALSGYVTHRYKADRVALLVSRVHGVREIQNQIEVLPTSTLDNRLRVELAKNIYGNSLFWNDAIRIIPPIRIIVDNLHVTLTGVVFSEVEKRVAADIVQQTVGVLTFRNNLEVESEIES